MQKHVNLVDLVKSVPTNIFLQKLASIQRRTSPIKFAHLAEKSERGSISKLSTKLSTVDENIPKPNNPSSYIGTGGRITPGGGRGAMPSSRPRTMPRAWHAPLLEPNWLRKPFQNNNHLTATKFDANSSRSSLISLEN